MENGIVDTFSIPIIEIVDHEELEQTRDTERSNEMENEEFHTENHNNMEETEETENVQLQTQNSAIETESSVINRLVCFYYII